MEPKIKKPENVTPPDFVAELDAILRTPLTPENFVNYGNDALTQLIDLTDEITENYRQAPTIDFGNSRDEEDAAFSYFHLPDISRNLDFIAKSQDLIDEIRARVQFVKENPDAKTILPPDSRNPQIEAGDGSFEEEKSQIPRTEMLMFLLANRFGVNLDDAMQFQISHGKLAPNAMRGESYSAISVNFAPLQNDEEDSDFDSEDSRENSDEDSNNSAQVSRLIFVCDAPKNSTFIINADVARDLIGENFAADLANLGKDDLKDLLVENPALGQSLVWIEKTWLARIAAAMENPQKKVRENGEKDKEIENVDLLIPLLGEGEITINMISREVHVNFSTVSDFVSSNKFPSIGKRRHGSQTVDAFDHDKLKSALVENGIVAPIAASGETNTKQFARKVGIERRSIKKLIMDYGLESIG